MSLKQACLIDSLFIETDLEKPILYEPLEPKLAHDTIIETIDIMQKSCVHKNNNPNLYIEVEKISHEHLSELIDQGWCRRGKRVMKPILDDTTCCSRYGLRTELTKFRLTRSLKISLKRMKKYIQTNVPDLSETCQEEKSEAHPELSQEELLDFTQKEMEEFLRTATKEKSKKGDDIDKVLGEELKEIAKGGKHNIEVSLVALNSPEFNATYQESFDLFCKWNRAVHDQEDWCNKEFFDTSFCITPLQNIQDEDNELGVMGTFHLHFRIDGKLVGVAEIDILTKYLCVNLNWYHPEYRVIGIGIFMIMSNMSLAYQISKVRPELKYFSGGVIETNRPRQNYKCYLSTEMLCDWTRRWVPIADAVRKIHEAKGRYASFLPNELPMKLSDFFSISCLFNGETHHFGRIRKQIKNEKELEENLRGLSKAAGLVANEFIVKIQS